MKTSFARSLLAPALGLALSSGCTPAQSGGAAASSTSTPAAAATETAKAEPGAGAAASDFTLRDVDGRSVSLSDYAGKVVLIDFWATWCVPCEAEIPHLQDLYEKHKDAGFVVLAISMDGPETIASVAPFVRRYNLGFPVLLDEETKVVGVYNPKRTAPLSVLIDKTGKIVRVRSGFTAGDENLIADDVSKALAGLPLAK
jgi:peroxiredoxin